MKVGKERQRKHDEVRFTEGKYEMYSDIHTSLGIFRCCETLIWSTGSRNEEASHIRKTGRQQQSSNWPRSKEARGKRKECNQNIILSFINLRYTFNHEHIRTENAIQVHIGAVTILNRVLLTFGSMAKNRPSLFGIKNPTLIWIHLSYRSHMANKGINNSCKAVRIYEVATADVCTLV